MQRVDLDAEPPEHYEYLRSRKNKLVPPEPHLTNVVEAGWFHVAEEIAEAIAVTVQTNSWTRPEGYRTPDHVAEDFLGMEHGDHYGEDPRWLSLMKVGLWLAKMLPEYWGVTNPEREGYCTACGKARPLDTFTHHESRCDKHF